MTFSIIKAILNPSNNKVHVFDEFSEKNSINQKVVWNNRPSVFISGVARYDLINSDSNDAVEVAQGDFRAFKGIMARLFHKAQVDAEIDFQDVSGLASAHLYKTYDESEYVDLDHFVESECGKYASDISEKNLAYLIPQIQEALRYSCNFTIFGWNNQLYQSIGDVAHRTCAAVYIARQLNIDIKLTDRIECISIDPVQLDKLNNEFQIFLIPVSETHRIDLYLEKHKLEVLKLSNSKVIPCNSFLYVLKKDQLPKDFYIDDKMNQLNRFYTDFNKVLYCQYQVQKRNTVYNKYRK